MERTILGIPGPILLGLLLVALAAMLLVCVWQVAVKRSAAPGFFLAALLLHLLLVVGSFFVYLGDEFVRTIKRQLQERIVAADVRFHSHQSHQPGEQPYEKVADLTAPETIPADPPRRITEAPQVPELSITPAPRIPPRLGPDPSQDRATPTVRVLPRPRVSTTRVLARRSQTPLHQQAEQILVEPTRIVPAAPEAELEPPQVPFPRQAIAPVPATPSAPTTAPAAPLPVHDPAELQAAAERAMEAATRPESPRAPLELPRSPQKIVSPIEPATIAPVAAVAPPAEEPGPPAARVEIKREAPPSLALSEVNSRPLPPPDALLLSEPIGLPGWSAEPNPQSSPAVELARDRPIAFTPADRQAVHSEPIQASQAAPSGPPVPPPGVAVAREPPPSLSLQSLGTPASPSVAETTALPLPSAELIASHAAAREAEPRAGAPTVDLKRMPPTLAARGAEPVAVSAVAAANPSIELALPAVSVPVTRPLRNNPAVAPEPSDWTTPASISAPPAIRETPTLIAGEQSVVPPAAAPKLPLVRAATASAASAAVDHHPGTAELAEVSYNQEDASTRSVPEVAVAVTRDQTQATPVELGASSAHVFGGRHDPLMPRLLAGSLDRQAAETPPSSSPIASRLARLPALAPATRYADDNVTLRALLQRRNLDEGSKLEVIRQFGGSDAMLETIHRGLAWIETHQHADGHWGLHDFAQCCRGHSPCSGHGSVRSDTAATGLALLPLLGDGNTHRSGKHRDAVARGIRWLVEHQKADGDLFTDPAGNPHMYSHGIAAIALCECYGMTGDGSLRGPAQRAIDFIVAAQDDKGGGWRYRPGHESDTSVVGWQVMALKSGQMADLNVPQKTLDGALRWLDSVSGQGSQQGQFAYQAGRFNPAMTAEGLLCMQFLGADRDAPCLRFGGEYLRNNLPAPGRENSYYWYYATQVMFHLQGHAWEDWSGVLNEMLVQTQHREGPLSGTWDAKDQWEHSGGRLYATSLRLLMLEVSYRHLPLYQILP